MAPEFHQGGFRSVQVAAFQVDSVPDQAEALHAGGGRYVQLSDGTIFQVPETFCSTSVEMPLCPTAYRVPVLVAVTP